MARHPWILPATVVALATVIAWSASRGCPAGPSDVPIVVAPRSASEPVGKSMPLNVADPARSAATEPGPLQAAGDLTISVSDSSGLPYAALRVAAMEGPRIVGVDRTNAHGSVQFPPVQGAVSIFVIGGEFIRKRVELSQGQGRHAIEIERGRSLAGRLIVDGAEPAESVQLVLGWSEASEELAQLPAVLVKSLNLRVNAGRGAVAFLTDPSGVFALDDLNPAWSGRVELPVWLETEAGEPAFAIAAPRDNLELRARLRPAIIGRVVAAGSREPVLNAHLTATVRCERGEYTDAFVCTAEGRFRIPLTCGGLTGAQIWIHAGEQGACTLEVGPVPDGRGGVDLGDVELGIARQAVLHVVREEGEPIQGASIGTESNTAVWSASSDEEGWLVTPVLPLEVDHLIVSALAYRSATVVLPPIVLSPIEVVLHPINAFVVRVSRPTGERLRGIAVIIEPEDASPFEPPFGEQADPKQLELGATLPLRRIVEPATAKHSKRLRWVFRTNQDGEVLITGLRAGTGLIIHVEDAGDATIVAEQRVAIGGSGRQSLDLVVLGEPKSMAVRVRDNRKTPIPGARVQLNGNAQSFAMTDKQGVATITGLFADVIELSISAERYCAARARTELVAGTQNEFDVLLERGRSIAVDVLDANGQPAPVDWVNAFVDGASVGVTGRIGVGRFSIQDVPERALVIQLIVGGARIESSHAADESSIVESLPASGSVRLSFDASVVFKADSRMLQLRRTSPTDVSILIQVRPADLAGEMNVPIVFPGTYEVRWLDAIDDSGRLTTGVPGRVTVEPGRATPIRVGP